MNLKNIDFYKNYFLIYNLKLILSEILIFYEYKNIL